MNYLSVILLLGLALEKVPLPVWQPLLAKAMLVMRNNHPALFQRLQNTNFDYLIDAYDLPFVFYLQPSLEKPLLKAIKRQENIPVSATIKGSLENLLSIFEGKIDGDADFFSGNLVIEGNTAAIVQLRNAVDSEDINIIQDLAFIFPRFPSFSLQVWQHIITTHNAWQSKLNIISNAITGQVNKTVKNQGANIDSLYEEIDSLKSMLKKYNKEDIRKKSDYNKT